MLVAVVAVLLLLQRELAAQVEEVTAVLTVQLVLLVL
jgi:hypothetical protein